jgi:hypothetical protein
LQVEGSDFEDGDAQELVGAELLGGRGEEGGEAAVDDVDALAVGGENVEAVAVGGAFAELEGDGGGGWPWW